MPTGLTAKIYDGEDMSLRNFALKCATHIGYGYYASECGEADLPLDKAPVMKPDGYHKKRLEEAKAELESFLELKKDPEALRKKYEEEMALKESSSEEYEDSKNEIKERYLSVLDKVNDWDVPEELKSLKDLMKSQLNESIEFDCSTYNKEEKKRPSIEEWVNYTMYSINWDIEYHEKKYQEEIKNAEECNKYLKILYEELDKAEPLA